MAKKKSKPAVSPQPAEPRTAFGKELEEAWKKSRTYTPPINPGNFKDGLYAGLDFNTYCAIDAVNNSRLSLARHSPAHYRYGVESVDTPYFRIGSLIHAGHLEPDRLSEQYVILPDEEFLAQVGNDPKTNLPYLAPRMTKTYKTLVSNFLSKNPGKLPINKADLEKLGGSLHSLAVHSSKFLWTSGQPEVTMIWTDPETGIRCKGRTDWFDSERYLIADLKTTEDLSRFDIGKFGYHVQAAFYLWGLSCLNASKNLKWISTVEGCKVPTIRDASEAKQHYWIVVVEKSRPYEVLAAPISLSAVVEGYHEFCFLLKQVTECTTKRRWPGPVSPDTWQLRDNFRPDYNRFYGRPTED